MTPFSEWLQGPPRVQHALLAVELSASSSAVDDIISALGHSVALETQADMLQRLMDWRSAWDADQESARTLRYKTALADIETRLTGSLTRAISPVLTQAIVKRSIAEFCDVLGKHLTHNEDVLPKIRSPRNVRQELANQLLARGIPADIEETDAEEVCASFPLTDIETDISRWVLKLQEALAA